MHAAVRERGEAWERHIVDSLTLLPVIDKHVASSMTPPGASRSSSSSSSSKTAGAGRKAAGSVATSGNKGAGRSTDSTAGAPAAGGDVSDMHP